ncbi:hypothetical protein [Streptomyces sp. TRM68367]|uniref:hypothetical protein n=1 Tax=Streptomyces sp. TRM68367 TaxID=2758415 RepID=UPI00165CC912|nr:hypothetical protein [Streptomyces sp. TRM68367]MBC9725190.1 hypothetical protein [Streptomyces sp. TRM68367]
MSERRRNGARRRAVAAIAATVGVAALVATGVNYASASSSAPQSAPSDVQEAAASVPLGGDGQTNFDPRHDRHDEGRIHVNERTYPADPGECIAVVSSTAPTSTTATFNVRNQSDKTIEFFNGITCDNGSPLAEIGPRSSANQIAATPVFDGAVVPFAIVGSFRVVDDHRHK